MKIIFCLGGLTKGGEERVVVNLSNKLCAKHEIVIIGDITKIEYDIDKKVKIRSIVSKNRSKNFFISNIKRLVNMYKIILEESPDIIIAFLKEPTARVLFLKKFFAKIRRIPLIISVRNDPNSIFNNAINKLAVKFLYDEADGYIFQTNEAKEYFIESIQKKSIIIPNPINPEFVCEPWSGKRDSTIVTVGRLSEEKNQKLLIDAFAKITEKYDKYQLLIYGDGGKKEELLQYVESLKLDNKIFFKGVVNNIKDEIYKAGMFVLSSNFEGMPNALMEALTMGIPCISTDCPCGGPKFLIQTGKTGLLVPIKDVNELAKAMTIFIEDKKFANQLGKNANEAMKMLSPDIINEKWEKYIYKILEENKG